MINGIKFNWESITIQTPWGTLVEVTSIKYSIERGVNKLKGAKGRTTGWSRKGQESDGSLSLRREEFQQLLNGMDEGVLGDKPMTITVSAKKPDGSVFTDTLPDVLFSKAATGSEVDDEDITVDLDMEILSPIKFDGKSPFKEAA